MQMPEREDRVVDMTGEGDVEEVDPMETLHVLEDNIWNPLPLTNLHLKIKRCQVAHSKTMGILSLCHMLVDPTSEQYRKTYITMFKALVDKKVVRKTSDSHASMPSVNGLTQFINKEDADIIYQPNPNYCTIQEEVQLPPTLLTPSNITFSDLLDVLWHR